MANQKISDSRRSHATKFQQHAVTTIGIATALATATLSPASMGSRKEPDFNMVEFVSSNTELPTSRIASSLRNLDKLLPNQSEALYEYARILADNLNPNLIPDGFLHQARTTLGSIYDESLPLSEKTKSFFQSLSQQDFLNLNDKIPVLAQASCSPDFALAVRVHSSKPDNWLIDYLNRTPRQVLV